MAPIITMETGQHRTARVAREQREARADALATSLRTERIHASYGLPGDLR